MGAQTEGRQSQFTSALALDLSKLTFFNPKQRSFVNDMLSSWNCKMGRLLSSMYPSFCGAIASLTRSCASFGTHYSSAMSVVGFLLRLPPFTESYLDLQGGEFDHADRMFWSIPKAWASASSQSRSDVRELIPEFFYLSDFLINANHLELGK